MASTQQLKSRIRSVKSTKQITKAMQMVAASKMRRAQDSTKGSAPYARAANELLTYFASLGETDEHPLFVTRKVKSRLLIVVAADKGLAGAYNTNVVKQYLNALRDDDHKHVTNHTIAVGRKAAQFVTRLKATQVVGIYEDMSDRPEGQQFHAILNAAIGMYERQEVDAVDVVFTKFISSITQTAETVRLLPAGFTKTEVSSDVSEAKFEPSIKEVLDATTYRLVGSRLYQTLLDARASEHSMRMLAMKNATDNANDLVDDLTLEMNKARQGAITQELSEITAGVESMK